MVLINIYKDAIILNLSIFCCIKFIASIKYRFVKWIVSLSDRTQHPLAFQGFLFWVKLLRINLENWIENSRGAGAVRIKSPSLVAYLYPEPFKCEEMRDECRPFPSNSNAMAAEHRGYVPPSSHSYGNPRRKKKEKNTLGKEWDGDGKVPRKFNELSRDGA